MLFGSRVDDTKKGGDIDSYIRPQACNDFSHKIRLLVLLERKTGEQKIGVVMATDMVQVIPA
jgi:hypothetical protein